MLAFLTCCNTPWNGRVFFFLASSEGMVDGFLKSLSQKFPQMVYSVHHYKVLDQEGAWDHEKYLLGDALAYKLCKNFLHTLISKKIVPLTIAMVEEIYKLGFRRQISLVESFSGIYWGINGCDIFPFSHISSMSEPDAATPTSNFFLSSSRWNKSASRIFTGAIESKLSSWKAG